MSKIVALCKRRGIIFPSSEIYGGVGSTYDYGPYGVEMKNNLSQLWWQEMTLKHDNIVGLDSAVILHPRVWEASGHLKHFSDPMIDCKVTKKRYKDDDLIQELTEVYTQLLKKDRKKWKKDIKFVGESLDEELGGMQEEFSETDRFLALGKFIEKQIETDISRLRSPACNEVGALTPPRQFHMMFKTTIGPVDDPSAMGYFRPETAQGIYLDYKLVQDAARLKLPFGIAQIGKAYRNEITPGNFIFRTREFEQMEMQFFIRPGENAKWLEFWREQRWNWLLSLGVREEKMHWYEHPENKLAHYAQAAFDIEYDFPFGRSELEGLHDRGEYDLNAHQEVSGKDLRYFDQESNERFLPHIVESSAGLNRTLLMLLCEGYKEDVQADEERTYLSIDPRVAPIKAAILPLVKKDGLADLAGQIADDLRGKWAMFLDIQGSIGRRYRRMDELGTPFAFTLDYQTLEDNTVTVRWRDTLQQERISKDKINEYLADKLI